MKVNQLKQWRWWGSSQDQFPMKLYTMLELAEANGSARSSRTVAWLPHGRAFQILDEEGFMDAVAPLFFRLTKIRSFHRQLHLWGFKRISEGIDAGAWYHESFLRGSPGELRRMVRVKIKGRPGNPPDDKEEPNFYAMPPLGGGRQVSTETRDPPEDKEEPDFCAMPPLGGGGQVSVEKNPVVDELLLKNRNLATNLEVVCGICASLHNSASSPELSKPIYEAKAPGRGCASRRNNASVPTSTASKANAGSEMPGNVSLHGCGNACGNDHTSGGVANTSWGVARPSTKDPSSQMVVATSDTSLELLEMHMKLPALERLVLREPELPGHASSPNSAPSPALPNPFHGTSEILDGGRHAPSAARFDRDGPLANLSPASRGVLGQKLGRRSKSSSAPESIMQMRWDFGRHAPSSARLGRDEALANPSLAASGVVGRKLSGIREEYSAFPASRDKSPSAAGTKPLPSGASFGPAAAGTSPSPVGVSPAWIDEEVKKILTAGLEPLPFGERPTASEAGRRRAATRRKTKSLPLGAPSALFPSDEEGMRGRTAGPEPLPFGGEPPVDQFADSMIALEAKRRRVATRRKIKSLPFGRPSGFFPSDDYEKRRGKAGLEPLALGGEHSVDEFANYIDSTIQIL